ncbi:MAG: M23 family metallopeptidase [Treponema sp.]|nr:M23 family metallopeptidase [Treponema sp.]
MVKLSVQARRSGKDILRLVMALCLVSFALSFAGVSIFRLPAKGESAGGGMGGGGSLEMAAADPESAAVFREQAALIAGVAEPELFSKPQTLLYGAYTIQGGDYIGNVAANFGLNEDTLLSINNIKDARRIQIGQVLKIPNQDGILYKVRNGDTLGGIAEKHRSDIAAITTANELFSDTVHSGTALFIPGAKLDWVERQEINGDLFIRPIGGYLSSPYGYRISPFTGARQFHSGLDLAAPTGTPVRAAMSGRVSTAGWSDTFGNYVVITHHSGYRTLYGHMNVIRVRSGAYVGTGERIGDVGSTGLSTGPHLHFTVYKNGATVNPRALMK